MSFAFIRGFQGNNVLLCVHNGSIDFASWSFYDIHFIEELYNADLRDIVSVNISDTDVFFWLKVSHIEFEEFRINA